MKQKMIVGFILLGILSIIIGVFMHFDILNSRPMFVKWYAGIIIACGTILLGYITLSHDSNSSKKTDDILEGTKTTGSNVIDLNKKADTSNHKIDILREENQNLKLKVNELNNNLSEKNNEIILKANALIQAQRKINELQNETILQVVGDGYPKLVIMNAGGQNFNSFVKGSTNYPIYEVNLRVTDAKKLFDCNPLVINDKIEINKSCFDSCLKFSNDITINLNGELMQSIGLLLPKNNYYLVTEFMSKSINNVQYSIVRFENNKLEHSYRIYKVSKIDHSILELLENSNTNIPTEEWTKYFFFTKTVIVDFAK